MPGKIFELLEELARMAKKGAGMHKSLRRYLKSDREYLIQAYVAATLSPDPSTQNGAVIAHLIDKDYGHLGCELAQATVEACNRFPEGVELTGDRLERPLKYQFIEHAERGVIYAAARQGVKLNGLTMYVPWAACSDCARAIICSGIERVVTHQRMMDATPPHWKESIAHAFTMFKEANIEITMFQEELPEAPMIRFNGEMWQP